MNLKKILHTSIISSFLLSTSISSESLEDEILYCGYPYDSLLNNFKQVRDADLEIADKYFVAYNSDSLGIRVSQNSNQIYMVLGRENVGGDNQPELPREEICPIVNNVFRDKLFYN